MANIKHVIRNFRLHIFQLHRKDTETVARRCSIKKAVPKNLAKFTVKHLCRSLVFTEHLRATVFFFLFRFTFTNIHNHRTAEEGGGYYLTPLYPFHPLHRHFDINRVITAESSPLRIASSRARTGNLWFPSRTQSLTTKLRAGRLFLKII